MKKKLLLLLPLLGFFWIGPTTPKIFSEGVVEKVPVQGRELSLRTDELRRSHRVDFKVSDPDLNGAVVKARHMVRPLSSAQKALVGNEEVSYFAAQPYQAMSLRFGDQKVEFRPDRALAWEFAMELSGDLEQMSADTIGYRRGGILEWFRNAPEGLEHGYTLTEEPKLDERGWARLQSTVAGNLSAHSDGASKGDLIFKNEDGADVLGYRDLRVWDATGRELAAAMEPTSDGFTIAYAGSNAVYPVTVDPTFIHVQNYISQVVEESPFYHDGDFASLRDFFGNSVAMSDEWAFVTNYSDDGIDSQESGAVYAFRRVNSTWEFWQRLTGLFEETQDYFGRKVVLDGDRLFVSADGAGRGVILIFELEDEKWVRTELVGVSSPLIKFGENFVASGDVLAATASENIPGNLIKEGIMVMRKSGGVWNEVAFLNPDDVNDSSIGGDHLGNAMSLVPDALGGSEEFLLFAGVANHDLSGDGSSLSNVGAVYVFKIRGPQVGLLQKISASPLVEDAGLLFGNEIVAHPGGDFFYVSATGYDRGAVNTDNHGIVFRYRRDSATKWVYKSEIESPGTAQETLGESFGEALQLTETRLFAGTRKESLLVFRIDGGAESFEEEITKARPVATPFEKFGQVIAATDQFLLLGITGRQPSGLPGSVLAGGVEIFQFDEGRWQNTDIIDPVNPIGARSAAKLSHDFAAVSLASATTAVGTNNGVVFVFQKTSEGWEVANILELPAGGDDRGNFGNRLALSDDFLAVATNPESGPTGRRRVIVFKRVGTNWTLMDDALMNDSDEGDEFGISLSISGDVLAVGAREDNNPGLGRTGSVSFFELNPPTNAVRFTGTMFLSGGKVGDEFGAAVSLSGKTVLVGAPGVKAGAGEAYVLRRVGGQVLPSQTLIASDGESGDDFGSFVGLGDGAMVGAPNAESPFGNRGIAYVYKIDEGVTSESTQLFTSGDVQGGAFSAAMSDDRIAIGYTRHLVGNTLPGAVFVYKKEGSLWPLELRLDYPGEVIGPAFGSSLSLSGDRILIGSKNDRPLLPNGDAVVAGSVFLIDLGSAEELYETWTSARGLSGPEAEPGATPNGISNLADYGFGISESAYDPEFRTRADVNAPPFAVEFVELDDDEGTAIKVSFTGRRPAGLTYIPQYNTNLATGLWKNFDEEPRVNFYNFNFDRYEYLQPITGRPVSLFVRVAIELTE